MKRTRTKKNREYYYPFTYTHHSPTKLFEEFTLTNYNNEKMNEVINFLKNIDDFDRTVFLLNIEYDSLRLVSEETNVSYSTINQIITKIKQDLIKIINK